MILVDRVQRAVVGAALAGLLLAGRSALSQAALDAVALQGPVPQTGEMAGSELLAEPGEIAQPLAEDRGQAAAEQALKRLSTTASVLMIVAHPDDEDGALLTYLSRGLGARVTLLTLTRGEGGQNVMSGESYDALGLIRTNELLRADQYYGVKQLWGTEADFGFSKTQEESFAKWGHDRVLYDAVLAVRQERPQVIVSTFVGAVSDGHGHHQVSGEIAQETFKAAADPKVFPDQLKPVSEGGLGLRVWQPLAVYSMVPFAPVTEKGMFDYATGKWAPARFHNYVTGEWLTNVPSTDVTIQVGALDPALGRSYIQIAREGWGEQKSQNGGANPTLSGPGTTSYHLWAVAPSARTRPPDYLGDSKPWEQPKQDTSLFRNRMVSISTWIADLSALARSAPPRWLVLGMAEIGANLRDLSAECKGREGVDAAHKLAAIYKQTLDLRARVHDAPESELNAGAKDDLLFELDLKISQFQEALKELLGLDLIAFTTKSDSVQGGGPFRGSSADEMPRGVTPGEEFKVRVHTAKANAESRLEKVWLESRTGAPWKAENANGAIDPAAPFADPTFRVHAADNSEPTQPYFTRPSIEQPYYEISRTELRLRSFAPYPLTAWAEFTFDGLPIRVGRVVQTMHRELGPGGVYEPLVVTPAIGLRMEPDERILPLGGSALPVKVTVHTETAAEGTVTLELPKGWTSQPSKAEFHRDSAGDTEPILFSVSSDGIGAGAISIKAVAHSGGHDYQTGWQSIGYSGLRPYNLYKPAQLTTRKVDVKLASGLRIGYVMGPGDEVPEALEAMGCAPHLLTAQDLASGDLAAWNVIVVGIRAYATRPELASAQPRLDEFVRRGGTLIAQYQSGNFPAPLPMTMGRMPERVVDEQAPVKLLDPAHRLFHWPNEITAADFDGWVEERGHSFMDSWDQGYTALTESADAGQDPQRGGLLVAHPGKGTYIYVAYALYRQLPELVPGSYRILANLLSAASESPARGTRNTTP